ncbi:unnamed protein product [Vicia faba]|uniref:Uncharacterized protein n=1 Tax=Vicia faba TaxID=3906 RepID=A0AAV0ZP40_VICFA|nr:unnamed protein product [Vicia faba]
MEKFEMMVAPLRREERVIKKKGSTWRDTCGTLRIKYPGDFGGSKEGDKFKYLSLRLCEDSSEEKGENELVNEPKSEEEEVGEMKTLKLSLQSQAGFTFNKSVKVWVQIGDRQVVTLIDSGATSNFIASKLVELRLKVVDTPAYVIKQHFFITELGGSEMVLGMDWLASLGNIEPNFGNLCLRWGIEGKKHLNQGLRFFVQDIRESQTDEYRTEQVREWDELLKEFRDVFNMPSGLPPMRDHDRAILLKP